MKVLQYNKAHNLSKLHDEILAAIPALKPELGGMAIIRVESKNNDIWITVPDDTNEQAIQAVIDAHDPTPLPAPKTELEILQETVDQLVLDSLEV